MMIALHVFQDADLAQDSMQSVHAPATSEAPSEIPPESSPVVMEIAAAPAAISSIASCVDLQSSAVQALHTTHSAYLAFAVSISCLAGQSF